MSQNIFRGCEACLEVAGQHFEPVLGNKRVELQGKKISSGCRVFGKVGTSVSEEP